MNSAVTPPDQDNSLNHEGPSISKQSDTSSVSTLKHSSDEESISSDEDSSENSKTIDVIYQIESFYAALPSKSPSSDEEIFSEDPKLTQYQSRGN